MDWAQPLDLYCERLGPGLWAEPVNALSNLGFVVAGMWLLRRLHRRGPPGWDLQLLSWLMVLVGLGSAVFHTVATRWASILDIAFIAFFIYAFLATFARRVAGLPWLPTAWILAGYFVLDRAAAALIPRGALNGSVLYLPAFAGLLACTAFATLRHRQGAGALQAACALFSVSVVCRTVDPLVCDAWPLGTHFLWHLLNAGTLSLLVLGLAQAPRPAAPWPQSGA